MDNDDEYIGNNQKYSFLLGSALRNEDPDQFFSIYDRILPQDIPDDQVADIKDKARQIAELQEEEFNQLVLNARDYSLAQSKSMSHITGSRRSVEDKSTSDEEDDEEIHLGPYATPKMTYSSLNKDSCILDMDQIERKADNDSGFCNSSKATTSVGSYSDQEDSEEDSRAGYFDYFPSSSSAHTRTSSSVKITPTYHLEYDEAHEVESDKASVNDIDSPRSGKDSDYGIELRTFSRRDVNHDDDFETSEDSDTEVKFNPHSKLYGSKPSKNYYTPMTAENTEDYGNDTGSTFSTSSFSFENSQRALKDRSASSLLHQERSAEVDDRINFSMYSRHMGSHCGTTYGSTSDRVRIEKSSKNREHELVGGRGPPFGSDFDHLNKVGNSIDELISGPKQNVDGMPEGRPISQTLDLAGDHRKKSKKKKRGTRDDLDENGNPSLEERSPLLGSHSYRHMRVQPRNITKNTAFPGRIDQFSGYTINGQQIRDLDDPNSLPSQDNGRKRKKVKKEKGVERKAEDVENYVGNKGLDELLSFIENDGMRHPKNSKKLPVSDPQTEKNRKNKDKKSKVAHDKVEGKSGDKPEKNDKKYKEGELIIKQCEEATDCLDLGEKQRQETEKNNFLESMGNSTVKITNTDCEESHENDKVVENPCEDKELVEAPVSETESKVKECDSETTDKMDNSVPDQSVIQTDIEQIPLDSKSPEPQKSTEVVEVKKEISTQNGIKQNNIKNSKKKMANSATAAKKEGSSLSNNGPNPLSAQFDSTDMEDNFYIFTDIDSLKPVEEEFKEVIGKKKKKGISQVKEVPSVKEHSHVVRPVVREDRRRVPRSATPPPMSGNLDNMVPEPDESPDLSLSSFPALGSARQGQSFREGRRNSTGDVPKDIQLKSHDDSDIESVKSLPVASQALSPRLPMSYAKMAASPKPSSSSSASLGTEGDCGGTEKGGTDLKSAVWKGSITERRHSIGSSPEGKDLESPPSRQKFGSQELVKSGDPEVKSAEVLQESVPSDNMDNDAAFSEPVQTSEEPIQTIPQKPPTSNTDSQTQVVLVESDTVLQKKESSTSDSTPCESVSSDSCSSDLKVNKSRSSEHQNNVKTHGTKTRNNKKVAKSNHYQPEFFDKRKNVPLDITFGEFTTDVGVLSDSLLYDSVEINSHNFSQHSSVSDKTLPHNQDVDHIAKSIGKTPDSKHSSPDSRSNKLVNKVTNHRDKDSLASKSLQELDGKNGIINHKLVHQNIHRITASDSSESISFMSDFDEVSSVTMVTDPPKISKETDASKEGKSNSVDSETSVKEGKDSVLVQFGDLLHNQDSEHFSAGNINFMPERGELTHQYNCEDVISFLHREWESVQSLKAQGGSNVTVYTDTE